MQTVNRKRGPLAAALTRKTFGGNSSDALAITTITPKERARVRELENYLDAKEELERSVSKNGSRGFRLAVSGLVDSSGKPRVFWMGIFQTDTRLQYR